MTLVERRSSKPCFLKILCASLRTSPSMPGRIWSRNSTTVTLAPSRRQTLPSSSPITPPPITTMWPGTLGSASAPVNRRSRFMVDLDAGQRRDARAGGDDDILRRVGLCRRRRPLSLPVNLRMALQPFDLVLLEQELDAAGQPLDRLEPCAVHRGRGRARRPDVFTPHLASAPECASSYSSDAWSSALDGMQPTLRQVPPSVSRLSTQAVLRPSCAARIAAT